MAERNRPIQSESVSKYAPSLSATQLPINDAFLVTEVSAPAWQTTARVLTILAQCGRRSTYVRP
eukprot:COSAG02_NODE_9383_length_2235_cov_1.597378_4_plen_63_part_01